MGLIELRKNLQKANLKRLRSKKILKIIVGSKSPYEISRNIPSPDYSPKQLHSRHPLSLGGEHTDCRASPFTHSERH